MHARKTHFSAQIARYRHLAKKVNHLLKDGSFQLLSSYKRRLLLTKLKARLQRIGHLIPAAQLKGALAGIGLLLGAAMPNAVQAQTFAPAVSSPFGIEQGSSYGYQNFADIDGDGDLDLLISSYEYDTSTPLFSFYENTGTAQLPIFTVDNFQVNPFGIEPGELTQPILADFDNDGDKDLISGGSQGFQYQENIGTLTSPLFDTPQANPFGLIQSNVIDFATVADLDGDGDLDVLGGGFYGELQYFENIGSADIPSFAPPSTNPFGIANDGSLIVIPNLSDLDGDGDYDLLYTSYYLGTEVYFAENSGTATSPSFEPGIAAPFGISTSGSYVQVPSTADIDGDGDTDVFLNDSYNSVINFFENLNINVAYPPSSANSTIILPEDGTYIFQPDDFVFTDQNTSDQLQAVQITVLPTKGSLKLGTANVNVNDVVPANQLGSLTYSPALNEFGNNYTTLKFKVYDGGLYSTDEYSMFFNITPVNDAPTTMDAAINASNDFDYVFDASDFPYTDIENQPLGSIKIISLPSKGSLKLGGANVTQGQTILNSQISALTYSGIAGEMGAAYTSFDFQISDGQLNSTSATMTINLFETLGTSNLDKEIQLKISPNPVTDVLNISFDAPVGEGFQVSIMNADGKILSQMFTKNQALSKSFQLDVASLPASFYFLKIETEKGVSTLKFVKI